MINRGRFFLAVVWLGLILGLVFTPPVAAEESFSEMFSRTLICFPQVAVGGPDGWETEIAIINPTDRGIWGELNFYKADGSKLGAAFPVSLPAHGRYEVEVGKSFSSRGDIQYITYTAAVYGVKGYTKFYTPKTRASIMASTPQTSGIFTKIDHAGWTGIAFVNTAASSAKVTLTAYNNYGNPPVAVKVLDVAAGEKVVNTPEKIFAPQSPAGATYIEFRSTQGIVGFFLNGDWDGARLDGSKAL